MAVSTYGRHLKRNSVRGVVVYNYLVFQNVAYLDSQQKSHLWYLVPGSASKPGCSLSGDSSHFDHLYCCFKAVSRVFSACADSVLLSSVLWSESIERLLAYFVL